MMTYVFMSNRMEESNPETLDRSNRIRLVNHPRYSHFYFRKIRTRADLCRISCHSFEMNTTSACFRPKPNHDRMKMATHDISPAVKVQLEPICELWKTLAHL